MSKKRKIVLGLIAVLIVAWGRTVLFTVDETEIALVVRFSRPSETKYGPGLHVKAPWPIDAVLRFDRRLLVFAHEPTEFLTEDKKNILIDTYAVWRIDDPYRFLAKVRNRAGAEARILDVVTSAIGEVVGKYPLSSFINTNTEEVKLAAINEELTSRCVPVAESEYGIGIQDVRINAFNFPAQNRASVIKRMQAERKRIATRYRSEGEEEALKIEAETELERRRILADARRDAERIRGEGEAEAIGIYGELYRRDPEFYRFLRRLEAYDAIVGGKTTLIMRSDSELWELLNEGAK